MPALAKFDNVAALLVDAYGSFHAKPIVNMLVLPTVSVSTKVSVKSYNKVLTIPVMKQMFSLDRAVEPLKPLRCRRASIYLLIGLTLDTLRSISYLACNTFKKVGTASLVMRTVKWIDQAEWRVKNLRTPFDDTRAVTKSHYKGYVETLTLGTMRVPGDVLEGHKIFYFRDEVWLHTTSVQVSLLTLRDEYPAIGIISPSFHEFYVLEQNRRVAADLRAENREYTRVIGVMNVGLH
ncbi:hypothetical protein L917_07976 [Phytophthora nicotianae]|uniref:Uncharacterized protein n=1 Tax=Phytophthora nicotianae TaxID=4792 RepID=W2LBE2_PHYNI|nr:hypothetical protein L917_07976 [Phytophthora nicotianae]